ncbi:Eukaryotic translation initiation factor 4H [Echinococcus granulosus]|uniref:Eukaryotic translation initiation factor 4H n=1 Tax=Echinococcus granulosus TaxID=6210 RepID=W6V184_ECHGR|nr:Eukaryotic translation initiation factor 4H [Echinococcus granulosus]EUB59604.1 Eukaryotic translation initiation factor 4H [Echinococcus granulosus]
MIDSWRLTDRQRLLDTSLSMSELNALGGVSNTRKLSAPPPLPLPLLPPPRPPETYRRQLHSRAQTEEPRRETIVSSKGSSVRFLGFWKRPEAKKKQQQQQGEGRVQEELRSGGPRPQRVATTAAAAGEERELLEVAAELKWLILESSRQLTDLCREEERLTGRLPVECIPECKAGHSAGPLTVITRSITCHSPGSFPTDSSITPRSAVSATAVPREFSATTVSMNESWSLKRLPPTAIERFDSTGRTTISSTLSTSSTSRQREQHGGPHCQIPSHLIDQKSKVVSRVHPPLRVSASRGVYEMGNWLSESQTNYRQVQSRRGTIVLSEACRQSSEPPIVFKACGIGSYSLLPSKRRAEGIKAPAINPTENWATMVPKGKSDFVITNLLVHKGLTNLAAGVIPFSSVPFLLSSDCAMAQGHAPDAMADYSREVFYSPHQRQHNYRYYQQQQRQHYHHYHPQEEQQKHQRLRQRFPAYETGDEAVERMQVELRAGHAPQWSVSVSPQSVSRREKTPGPPQAAFYISPRNPPDYSLGARQSCPLCTHSRSAYPEHEGEHTRTRNYVTAKRTAVYRAGDRPAVNFNLNETPRYRVYVGNLPKNCLQSHLEEIFDGCKIASITMVHDSNTDKFKGYAYVELRDEDSYNKARSYDKTIVNGQEIRVNDAERGGNRGARGRGDFNGRAGNVRGGGRQGGVGGNGFGNRPRPGAYRPRVQPGVAGFHDDYPTPPLSNRSGGGYIPPPNFDAADRPRLSLKPRSTPVNALSQERELSERSKAIFGVGKPRDPSPSRCANISIVWFSQCTSFVSLPTYVHIHTRAAPPCLPNSTFMRNSLERRYLIDGVKIHSLPSLDIGTGCHPLF